MQKLVEEGHVHRSAKPVRYLQDRRRLLVGSGEANLFDFVNLTLGESNHVLQVSWYSSFVVVGVRTYQDDESHSRRIVGLCAQLLPHFIVGSV